MSEKFFRTAVIAIGLGFLALFCIIVVPPLMADGDILGVMPGVAVGLAAYLVLRSNQLTEH